MKSVAILQKSMVHYRRQFFEKLRDELKKEGIELTLIYGKNIGARASKKDEVELSWGIFKPNRVLKLGDRVLIWQPCLKELSNKDLIIVEQANKLLINYLLVFLRPFRTFKLGYWGHGRNIQDHPNSLSNRFKYLFIKKCDWWFAYTEGVKDFLSGLGFPEKKVTVVQNAIDTAHLQEALSKVEEKEVQALKDRLGIPNDQVGIFCGGMYPEKHIDFLLESCLKIKQAVPDFHMIFIGAGIDAHKVKKAAQEHSWIHYEGPHFGEEKIPYFKLAGVQLMPGLVGLGILDSFALQTPIVTTDYEFHSPEIEYLENGKNGLMTPMDTDQYAEGVIALLQSGHYRDMIAHCKKGAAQYTIEQMVENFKNGILEALNQ